MCKRTLIIRGATIKTTHTHTHTQARIPVGPVWVPLKPEARIKYLLMGVFYSVGGANLPSHKSCTETDRRTLPWFICPPKVLIHIYKIYITWMYRSDDSIVGRNVFVWKWMTIRFCDLMLSKNSKFSLLTLINHFEMTFILIILGNKDRNILAVFLII